MSIINYLSDLFQGSPLSTPIGCLVEEATDDKHPSENLALFLKTCDAIHSSVEGPKCAVRALRRRFSQSVMLNHIVAGYTLSLLETCVKNCGYRFHIVLANREALHDFTKFLQPGGNDLIPIRIQDKLLRIIQGLATAFEKDVDLQEFVVTYRDLVSRGIQFPAPIDGLPLFSVLDSDLRRLKISRESLIKPPTRPITNSNSLYYSDYDSATSSVPENTTLISNDQSNHLVSGAVSTTTLVPSALPTPLAVCDLSNMARKKKLFDDLAKVDQNVLVLNMMLAENAELANSVELSDDTKSLMQALASAITAMSDRLVSLIPRWEALVEQSGEHHNEELDEITMELLSHNDSCNTVLTRYNRFVRTLAAGTTAGQPEVSEVLIPGLLSTEEEVREMEDFLRQIGDEPDTQVSEQNFAAPNAFEDGEAPDLPPPLPPIKVDRPPPSTVLQDTQPSLAPVNSVDTTEFDEFLSDRMETIRLKSPF